MNDRHDLLIKGGTVIDGTGSTGTRADVAVRDGRISAIGDLQMALADEVIDATGAFVAPGIVDAHTHYDAQLFWDPDASPSNVHGVTTVVGGNCGFTIAPIRSEDTAYTREMLASVEGMPVEALEAGAPWDWETFGEFLDRLDGDIGVNATFMVGHCALRRYVMGPDSVGDEATPEQVEEMRRVLAESLEAMLDGCLDRFSDDEVELLVSMSATAGRPVNWNVMTLDSSDPDRMTHQLAADDRARESGGRVVALTMPVQVPMNMSFLNHCGLFLLPGWGDVLRLPVPERIEKLRDPEIQAMLVERSKSEEAGIFRRLADFANYQIGDTYSDENDGLTGCRVGDIAAERGTDPFATLIDIVIADGLRTVLWPIPPDDDEASWDLRRTAWEDPRAMIGGSDAGAHLDRMCGAPFPTRFLADCLRGRQLISVERAVQLMTQIPANLFGLIDRGTIEVGNHADLFIFDPETIGSEMAALVDDLPAGSRRLTARSRGVHRVFVNGTVTVVDGEAVGNRPGKVLRSGHDTRTVSTV